MSHNTPAPESEEALAEVFRPPPGQLTAKQKRMAIIQSVVALVIIVVIFGWLLPSVIDYREIFDALKTLEWWQFALLLVAGLIVYLPEGWLYALLVPGLTWWRGIKSWVASTGVGSTVPAMDLVVRYGMYRSYGASPARSMLGIFLSGIFDNITKFSLPVIALIVLAIAGVEDIPGAVILIAVIAALIVAGTLVVAIGVARSERFALWLGRTVERVASWFLGLFKKGPVTGLSDRVVTLRDAALETVSAVWPRAFLASAMGKLWTYVILLIALRIADIPSDVISAVEAFLVWSLVLLVASIPLTPGGVGFVEAAYIALFGAIAGSAYSTEIGVAVVLYRAAQWALPIVVGWLTVGWWRLQIRRGNLSDPFRLAQAEPAAG